MEVSSFFDCFVCNFKSHGIDYENRKFFSFAIISGFKYITDLRRWNSTVKMAYKTCLIDTGFVESYAIQI